MAVPFPKRLSFSAELPLYFCEKSASHTCVGQFLGPLFCSLDLSNFPPKLYCLNSLSSIVRLEIKKCKSSILFLIVVQSLSHVWLFATPRTTAHQAGFPVPQYFPEFVPTHVRWVDDAIQPSHPLLLLCLHALSLSQH